MIKFSKPNAEYISIKSELLSEEGNSTWVEAAKKISAVYRQQPSRTQCVACDETIGDPIFTLHEVEYAVCSRCGHLNGIYEDTAEFTEGLYEEDGSDNVKVYGEETKEAYWSRVQDIYAPKADFLFESLAEVGESPDKLRYIDIGAGGGHFVAALRKKGLVESIGYEASVGLVDNANAVQDAQVLRVIPSSDLNGLVEDLDCDVLTMIFSLEHIREVRGFLQALRDNRRIKYFFFSVPLFNPSVFLEIASPEIMPRTAGAGHTHLFSSSSIDHICQEFGLKRASEWWFGGNAFDLYRQSALRLQMTGSGEKCVEEFKAMMLPLVDDLQQVFDKHRRSSEVHVLTALDRG